MLIFKIELLFKVRPEVLIWSFRKFDFYLIITIALKSVNGLLLETLFLKNVICIQQTEDVKIELDDEGFDSICTSCPLMYIKHSKLYIENENTVTYCNLTQTE